MVTSTCSTKMYNHLTSKNHIHHTIPQKFLSYTPDQIPGNINKNNPALCTTPKEKKESFAARRTPS